MIFHGLIAICLGVALSVVAEAQTIPGGATSRSVVVAGTAYRLEGPAQEAAPGQVMLLSIFGIKTTVPVPTVAAPTEGRLPTSLFGISVDLVQGSTVTPVELRAIQQGYCAVEEACSTVTQITLQIPFALQPFVTDATPGNLFSFLRISENRSPVGAVMLRPVLDRIHVLNSCDATQIPIGGASAAPPDICTPAVMVNQKLNSLYNLVKGGDTVALWAYGLGLLAQGTPAVTNSFPPLTDLQLNFDYRPNAPASPPVTGFGLTGQPVYFGYAGGGNYQVNFTIPPVPQGLPACDGVRITSNLTVTIMGRSSHDAAKLCVTPE